MYSSRSSSVERLSSSDESSVDDSSLDDDSSDEESLSSSSELSESTSMFDCVPESPEVSEDSSSESDDEVLTFPSSFFDFVNFGRHRCFS